MESKICSNCKLLKELKFFHRNKTRKDGYQYVCKECASKDYPKKDPLLVKLYNKKYKKEHRKEQCKYQIKYRKTSEDCILKDKVRAKTRRAVQKGRIIKLPCRDCNSIYSEAHHPDYSKPFEVIWLCRKHHLQEHRKCNRLN